MDGALLEKIRKFTDGHAGEAVSELFELCRIPSVRGEAEKGAPYGKYPKDALLKACEIAERYGISARINEEDGYAVLSCGNGDKSAAIVAHADVVPAGEGWTVTGAFEPRVKDGFIFGRGVIDDKLGIIAGIYAQRAVKELKLAPSLRVLTVAGSCEESGMKDIKAFAEKEPAPDLCIVADSRFPACFCEKDIINLTVFSDKPFENVSELAGGAGGSVPASAFARIKNAPGIKKELSAVCDGREDLELSETPEELVLKAAGIPAHTAHPEGSKNAVHVLLSALSKIDLLGENDLNIIKAAAAATEGYLGKGLNIEAEDEKTGYLTSVCFKAETRENALFLRFNIRACRGAFFEDIKAGVLRFCSERGFTLEKATHREGYYKDPAGKAISALMDVYRAVTKDADAAPFCTGGGTYARYLKNAVTFGPDFLRTPVFLPPGHGREHQPDECYSFEDFKKALKIYIAAICAAEKIL